jgi:GntR family transcriptional regulator/MocR family aminotransferase
VLAYGLAPYRVDHPGRPGLIFGYATLAERTITDGIDILADVIRRTGRRP